MELTRDEGELRDSLAKLAEKRPDAAAEPTKDEIRALHERQRLARLAALNGSFDGVLKVLRESLAQPRELSVDAISPQLVSVEPGSQEAQVFGAAALTWSVPVSQGFGRRLRFLVRDGSNGKLIGIIGLTDPVFNLRPRDAWVGWNAQGRKDRLVHVMDAFVLGGVPPYSRLLGGKLVALLAASQEVVRAFHRKYGESEGIISKKKKNPRLVLLTTTSALGRSSLYNRLRIPNGVRFLTNMDKDRVPVWQTQGYGHFHVDEGMFRKMVEVLARRNHPYASGNRFGDGPNWKIRVIRQAAVELGVPEECVLHGIRRQVYVIPLATNTRAFLCGHSQAPEYKTTNVEDIAAFWKERWGRPRAQRCPEWMDWQPDELLGHLSLLHSEATKAGERHDASQS